MDRAWFPILFLLFLAIRSRYSLKLKSEPCVTNSDIKRRQVSRYGNSGEELRQYIPRSLIETCQNSTIWTPELEPYLMRALDVELIQQLGQNHYRIRSIPCEILWVRLVGPEIILPTISDDGNGTYRGEYCISLPGVYRFEVVVLQEPFVWANILNPLAYRRVMRVVASRDIRAIASRISSTLRPNNRWVEATLVFDASIRQLLEDPTDRYVWRPCLDRTFVTPAAARMCLANKRILMLGDSYTRTLFRVLLLYLGNPSMPTGRMHSLTDEITLVAGTSTFTYRFMGLAEHFFQFNLTSILTEAAPAFFLYNFGAWDADGSVIHISRLLHIHQLIQAAVHSLLHTSPRVFWMNTQPWPYVFQHRARSQPRIELLNEIAGRFMEKAGVPQIDFFSMVYPRLELVCDDSHFACVSESWRMSRLAFWQVQTVLQALCPG